MEIVALKIPNIWAFRITDALSSVYALIKRKLRKHYFTLYCTVIGNFTNMAHLCLTTRWQSLSERTHFYLESIIGDIHLFSEKKKPNN